jgi:hypothetical protein
VEIWECSKALNEDLKKEKLGVFGPLYQAGGISHNDRFACTKKFLVPQRIQKIHSPASTNIVPR